MKNYSIEIQKLENGKLMWTAQSDDRNWSVVQGSDEIITSPNDNSCEFIFSPAPMMDIEQFNEFIKDILTEGGNI
ncbi:hypothetical protein TUM4644_35390 [Shewanella colwelliana]|uniref:hypothetical protein n=1 Tax=Shewanella colwelliana TaxID=23 RepID=UPI001BC09EDE|nr:hypothetical protein [Shewanella colwelliana]GIU34208.1 hypothetical protein TUM4644_35390 [Shewanella colwelliana]